MDLMDSQPEFTKAIWDYLDILVNDNRLAKGREILAKYNRSSTRRKKPMASTATRSRRFGHRVELFDHDGGPQCAAVHRDPGLHRPPPEILQG